MIRAVLAALAALAAAACAEPAPRARPNLLLITVDTLRADRLACYGGPADVGVAICALAANGARFEWAFSTAPFTTPSVVSILTSLYPREHRVVQSPASVLAENVVTLAEALKAQGWTTGAFVSNPLLDTNRHLSQGFDTWDQQMNRSERNRPGWSERDAREVTDAALAWTQTSVREPWFLWVHYQDPHGPYEPPGAAPAHDVPGDPTLPVLEDFSGRGGIPRYQEIPGLSTAAAYERRYLDEIRFLDPEVKRLVERLDGLFAPPVVLFTADHGEAFGDDGYWFAHGHSVGLDQIRVPLLVRPQPPTSGSVDPQAVSLLDVAPTLLAAAGIDAPPTFEGRPLPLAANAAAREARAVFAEHWKQIAVIEGARYYARERAPGAPVGERNLAYSPVLPARTARLPEDGRQPAYETPPADASELEGRVAGFLAQAPPTTPAAPTRELSEAERQRLHALGYTE